jgi:hypothetical protein
MRLFRDDLALVLLLASAAAAAAAVGVVVVRVRHVVAVAADIGHFRFRCPISRGRQDHLFFDLKSDQ